MGKQRIVLATRAWSLIVFLVGMHVASAQRQPCVPQELNDLLLTSFPELELHKGVPHEYRVTSYWHNRDIFGNTTNTVRITGEFTRWSGKDQVHCRWNNVHLAGASGPAGPFSAGQRLDYMEEFSYVLSAEIVQPEFFAEFPDADVANLLQTLVWDAPWMEVAYMTVDQLKYNQPHQSTDFENKDVPLAQHGILRMKDLRMTWTGLSRVNGEVCALIEYRSLSNPVRSESEVMGVNGRSCYWGSVHVSLHDKQVEQVALYEDVVMEMKFPGNPAKILTNVQREVTFEKLP